MTTAGVVLAAGEGSRFAASGPRSPKLLAVIDGMALVDHVIAAVSSADLAGVLVVDGAIDLSDRARAGVTVLHNDRWADGIATSLALAVGHAREAGHDAVVVGLADQPGVTADAWRALAAAPEDPPIAVATYHGRRGNPVRLHAAMWDLLPATGDVGARRVMAERPELVREVPCTGDPSDVDTAEDLERWS